jgi:MFS family permease
VFDVWLIGTAAFSGYPDSSSMQWRVSLGIQLLPAGLLALLIMLFPESPRWLMDKGNPDLALKTLARLHANGNVDDPWVQAEFSQIQEELTFEHEHEAKSYKELFVNKSSFRRLFLAVAIQASTQMTGVSAIQYYSVKIFKQIGIDATNTLRYQIYNSLIALFAQFCCMMFIDRLGRRWPLILGNLGNMVTFIIATILLAKFQPESNRNEHAAWGFISMTWLYNYSFSATCGPLSWIIPAEIFDTRTRARGVSIATMTSFAFNTLIGQTTSTALKTIRWRWYILFCVGHN